ncbi:MAG TPA: hypothetical protein VI757_16045 [Bacteroidia bacterium]|nr:hypothetical protein [Bacteroidia bacterium]
MKPTSINAGFRTIRLEYNNEKLPNKQEQKVLHNYPKFHFAFESLAKRFEELEKNQPGYVSSLQAALTAFEPLEKECFVIEYFFNKPNETPPAGINVPETMNSDFTNAVIKRGQSFDPLMKPLYHWVDTIHPVYKKWITDWDEFYERLDAFQKDVSLMYAHWEQGTVNISEFDVDSQKFYGFIDDLQKRYRKFSKEYNKLVLDYNNFLARITHSYEQINMVSDKTQEILKKLPGHGNNINLN